MSRWPAHSAPEGLGRVPPLRPRPSHAAQRSQEHHPGQDTQGPCHPLATQPSLIPNPRHTNNQLGQTSPQEWFPLGRDALARGPSFLTERKGTSQQSFRVRGLEGVRCSRATPVQKLPGSQVSRDRPAAPPRLCTLPVFL